MTEAELIKLCIQKRTTILPKRLTEPGPTLAQIKTLLEAATAAPDHQQIHPWRFVALSASSRDELARVFELDLIRRDGLCTAEQRAMARDKAYRSPLLWLAVVRVRDEHKEIPEQERLVSLGCALQNILLSATAMGYGSCLTTGQAVHCDELASLCKLGEDEKAVCFLSVGTVESRPKPKVRRSALELLSQV